jgi:acetate kinase
MSASILTINAGSSSLKFALFGAGAGQPATASGAIGNLRSAPEFIARDADGGIIAQRLWPGAERPHFAAVLEHLLAFIDSQVGQSGLAAAGHRIVHGGADYIAPVLVSPAVLAALTGLTPLDPMHMPHNLAPIQALAAARPELPQVACFDTAFHHTLPPVARQFALPRALTAAGVRRYGFHGLSYEFIAGRLAELSPKLAAGRVVAAHLGAGASLCGLLAGVSIATTTGFSALDGLVMATRCGRIDPGVLLYLASQGNSPAEIEELLYHRSGLLGISGISGDMRILLASTAPPAAEAIDAFTHGIACETAAMATALGGLDGIVFTAGIGQHAPAIRAQACRHLAWLGVLLDERANAADAPLISAPASRVEVRVLATNEEAMIARHTRIVVEAGAASPQVRAPAVD